MSWLKYAAIMILRVMGTEIMQYGVLPVDMHAMTFLYICKHCTSPHPQKKHKYVALFWNQGMFLSVINTV